MRTCFEKLLTGGDLFVFVESKVYDSDILPVFSNFNVLTRDRSRKGGGFLFLFREPFVGDILPSVLEEITVVKIRGPDLSVEIFIMAVCFPPAGCRCSDDTVFFDELAVIVNKLRQENRIFLVLGDFNSRTGKLLWYRNQVSSAESERVELIEVDNPDLQSNVRGKALRNVCSALDLIPINGLQSFSQSFPSELTCLRHNGASVVDHIFVPENVLSIVKYFDFPGYPVAISDHEPMRLELELLPRENGREQIAGEGRAKKTAASHMG